MPVAEVLDKEQAGLEQLHTAYAERLEVPNSARAALIHQDIQSIQQRFKVRLEFCKLLRQALLGEST